MSATERIAALQSQIAALEATISTLQSSRTPSTLSIALATAILAALGGYFYTQGSSIGLFGSSPSRRPKSNNKKSKPKPSSWPNSYDVTVHPDSSDDELMSGLTRGEDGIAASSSPSSSPASSSDEDKRENEDDDDDGDEEFSQDQGDLALFPSSTTEECKLTLVIRTDLSMTRGKIAAQASHATLANYRYFLTHAPEHPVLKRWEQMGQAKVALQVKSEDELLELQAKAVSLGLCAQVVRDAGRTQIAAGSVTCLGVGPGPKSVVDGVTGELKLL